MGELKDLQWSIDQNTAALQENTKLLLELHKHYEKVPYYLDCLLKHTMSISHIVELNERRKSG